MFVGQLGRARGSTNPSRPCMPWKPGRGWRGSAFLQSFKIPLRCQDLQPKTCISLGVRSSLLGCLVTSPTLPIPLPQL